MHHMNVIGIEDLTITVGVVVALCALIVTLWNAVKAIKEMTQPAKNLADRVDRIEDLLANDKKRLDDQEEAQKLLLRSMLALIEHQLTGNGEKSLKELKTDISTYLINR